MPGWLHGVFVGDWLFVFPLRGFSISLFCNYCPHLDICDSELHVRLRAHRAANAAPVVVTSSTPQQNLPIRTPPNPHAVCCTGPRPSTATACSPHPFPNACIGNCRLPKWRIDTRQSAYPFQHYLQCTNLLAHDAILASRTARIPMRGLDWTPAPAHATARITRPPEVARGSRRGRRCVRSHPPRMHTLTHIMYTYMCCTPWTDRDGRPATSFTASPGSAARPQRCFPGIPPPSSSRRTPI